MTKQAATSLILVSLTTFAIMGCQPKQLDLKSASPATVVIEHTVHDAPPTYLQPSPLSLVGEDAALQTGETLLQAYYSNTAAAEACAAQAAALWGWAVQPQAPAASPPSAAPVQP